jgi:hypothetical protein
MPVSKELLEETYRDVTAELIHGLFSYDGGARVDEGSSQMVSDLNDYERVLKKVVESNLPTLIENEEDLKTLKRAAKIYSGVVSCSGGYTEGEKLIEELIKYYLELKSRRK